MAALCNCLVAENSARCRNVETSKTAFFAFVPQWYWKNRSSLLSRLSSLKACCCHPSQISAPCSVVPQGRWRWIKLAWLGVNGVFSMAAFVLFAGDFRDRKPSELHSYTASLVLSPGDGLWIKLKLWTSKPYPQLSASPCAVDKVFFVGKSKVVHKGELTAG